MLSSFHLANERRTSSQLTRQSMLLSFLPIAAAAPEAADSSARFADLILRRAARSGIVLLVPARPVCSSRTRAALSPLVHEPCRSTRRACPCRSGGPAKARLLRPRLRPGSCPTERWWLNYFRSYLFFLLFFVLLIARQQCLKKCLHPGAHEIQLVTHAEHGRFDNRSHFLDETVGAVRPLASRSEDLLHFVPLVLRQHGEQTQPLGGGVHFLHHRLELLPDFLDQDRKSTRLNSSHIPL